MPCSKQASKIVVAIQRYAGGNIDMPIKIAKPTIIEAAGNKPKIIEEYVGFINSQTSDLSIARMVSPAGWVEPGQNPEFSEYTIILKGMLRVKTEWEEFDVITVPNI